MGRDVIGELENAMMRHAEMYRRCGTCANSGKKDGTNLITCTCVKSSKFLCMRLPNTKGCSQWKKR